MIALLLPAVALADFHAPPKGFWAYCGHYVWAWHGATHYTSCPFALNIGRGVRMSPDFGKYHLVGTAYSPVTHRTYSVNCIQKWNLAYRCTAGIGAIAWIG
jgi:hypothetical protein